jgi:hypothetical protein
MEMEDGGRVMGLPAISLRNTFLLFRTASDTPIHVGSTIFGGWRFRTTSATSASEKVISGCT